LNKCDGNFTEVLKKYNQRKLFIANFTLGTTRQCLIACLRIYYTVKYDLDNGNLGMSTAKSNWEMPGGGTSQYLGNVHPVFDFTSTNEFKTHTFQYCTAQHETLYKSKKNIFLIVHVSFRTLH